MMRVLFILLLGFSAITGYSSDINFDVVEDSVFQKARVFTAQSNRSTTGGRESLELLGTMGDLFIYKFEKNYKKTDNVIYLLGRYNSRLDANRGEGGITADIFEKNWKQTFQTRSHRPCGERDKFNFLGNAEHHFRSKQIPNKGTDYYVKSSVSKIAENSGSIIYKATLRTDDNSFESIYYGETLKATCESLHLLKAD